MDGIVPRAPEEEVMVELELELLDEYDMLDFVRPSGLSVVAAITCNVIQESCRSTNRTIKHL